MKHLSVIWQALWLGLLSLVFAAPLQALPGTVLFSDNFERAGLAPWTTTDASRSGISTATANSGTRSMYTRHDTVTVTSPSINTNVPAARLTAWIRRGADAIPGSEDTDTGEDLVVEYRNNVGTWVAITTYLGSGTKGEELALSFTLPMNALHATFAVRFTQTAGSGSDYDYWHIDDVRVVELAPAGPLVLGECDDFEGGLNNWTVSSSGGVATITGATYQSAFNALSINGGVVTVDSNATDTNTNNFQGISLWIRRGSDAFSEDPDTGEDLVVEYRRNNGTWVTLGTFAGNGTAGEVFTPTYNLPGNARHANFQVRLRMTGGSGAAWDFWHVDDVCLLQNNPPNLAVSKTVEVVSDGFSSTGFEKAIPGAIVRYTITLTNSGTGSPDTGSILLADVIDADHEMFVGDYAGVGSGPVEFIDGPGAASSGLSYTFSALANGSDDIEFYQGATLYTPAPPYDPNVTRFRVNPKGKMNGRSGGTNPFFTIRFTARIKQ